METSLPIPICQGLCYPGMDNSPETCGPFLGIPWDPWIRDGHRVRRSHKIVCSSKPIVNGVLIEWIMNCFPLTMNEFHGFPLLKKLLGQIYGLWMEFSFGSHVTFPRRPMSSSSLVANFAAGMPPAFAPWAAASATHVVAPTSNLKNHP